MRASETRTIGDFEVTTTKLPAMRGSALRFKIGKLIAPVLTGFRGKAIADIQRMDLADLQPAIVAALAQLDEKTHDALMLEALACTYVVRNDDQGKPIKFDLNSARWIDQAFDGDVDALWKAVWFALEVNLKGVFGASAGVTQLTPTP